MAWSIQFHPAVKKDFRRLHQEARDFILHEVLPSIAVDPYCGEMLHGPLRGLWKYTTGEHRIAYQIDDGRKEVVILEVGPRGGFYERLRRRLGK